MPVLGFNPTRLATLARATQGVFDELGGVASREPLAAAAVECAHGIGTALGDVLRTSLLDVLTSTVLTRWGSCGPDAPLTAGAGLETPLLAAFAGTEELVARLEAAGGGCVLPLPVAQVDSGFSLASAITIGDPDSWVHDVFPGCATFGGGDYVGGGYMEGPDGTDFPIVVPVVTTAGGEVFTADRHDVRAGAPSVATLGGTDPGWEVVHVETGIERVQETPDAWALGLAAATGLVAPVPPNSGLGHVVAPLSAPPYLAQAQPAQSNIATPAGPLAAPNTPSGLVVSGAAELSLMVGQGVVMATGADNQMQRSYRVIYEENDDGRRRARVETYSLCYDRTGDVVIAPEHLYVNVDGELVAQTISYGDPYSPAGETVMQPATDVADWALDGSEPIRYVVPQAVFP